MSAPFLQLTPRCVFEDLRDGYVAPTVNPDIVYPENFVIEVGLGVPVKGGESIHYYRSQYTGRRFDRYVTQISVSRFDRYWGLCDYYPDMSINGEFTVVAMLPSTDLAVSDALVSQVIYDSSLSEEINKFGEKAAFSYNVFRCMNDREWDVEKRIERDTVPLEDLDLDDDLAFFKNLATS